MTADAFDLLPPTEDTVAATRARLRAEGFTGEVVLEPGAIPPGLWCRSCGRRHLPERTTIAAIHRFDPRTSPDGAALLFALVCPRCDAEGVAVARHGRVTAPAEAELLAALAARAASRFPRTLTAREAVT